MDEARLGSERGSCRFDMVVVVFVVVVMVVIVDAVFYNHI